MLTLTVERTGLQTLQRVGQGLRALADLDFVPFFERTVEPDFERIEQEQFSSQGARGEGGAWEPLSPLYAQIKAQFFPGRPIMQLSGRLKGSLTQKGHQDAFRRVTRDSYERGTTVQYAATHNTGTDARMWIPAPFNMWINGVPRRELIGVTEADFDKWSEALGDYVGEQLGRITGGIA